MDNIGAEVGQKMRSAIKAKLMELDCYVDDELPDYIMVMVANKRTKSQMNEDLNLFLSTKTSTFVNWLHIVLKKLKEVTVTNPDIYRKVSKRKSDEHSELVKTKKEKKEKKVKKEEPPDPPEQKLVVKLDLGAITPGQQNDESLTDNLPFAAKSLGENRKVILTNSTEIPDARTGYEDNFDIPLMSEIQDCNEEDLDALERKIRNVKSRLGLLVESDTENPNNPSGSNVCVAKTEDNEPKETLEETIEQENDTNETNKEEGQDIMSDSMQISILEQEISESHNKELERLTNALEQEENEEQESYTPKRKTPEDDFNIETTESSRKEDNKEKSKLPERKHERITFNPDELSPKRPSVRERLGRKGSLSPEKPERRKNSFYAGYEEEKSSKSNEVKVHRDFKEWVALRQRDNSRDRRDKSRERTRDRGNMSWDRRARSRERRDRSWDRKNRRDNNWDKRDIGWDKRDKSWDRYERIREGRNRSRSAERKNRSRSRGERNQSKETINRNKDAMESSDGKEKVRESSRSPPKETKSESTFSRVMSKVSIPPKPPSEKSDDEQVKREVQSSIRVKRPVRTGKTQPNKNLLLRAVAEAQRSVAQAPKMGLTSPKKSKSIRDRLGTISPRRRNSAKILENEKAKLKSLLEQSRKNRILQRRLKLEGCSDSSEGEYVPKPVRKVNESNEGEYVPKPVRKSPNQPPEYVPSFKSLRENCEDSDASQSPKHQFIITLDGIDKLKKELPVGDTEEEKPKIKEETPPLKLRADGRKIPSPIVFNAKASTQSAVKKPKPNIPDKLPVVHPPLSIKNKERCKYWPGCRQGDKCEFVHPSQTCEAFPHCKCGDKCLYLHPKCKFGTSCTKKECPYDHNVTNSVIASQALAPGQNCKYYPNCTNPNCPFFHPKPCKYGKFCASKTDCPFLHNVTPKRSLSWSKSK